MSNRPPKRLTMFRRELHCLVAAVAAAAATRAEEKEKAERWSLNSKRATLARYAPARAEIRASIISALKTTGCTGTLRLAAAVGKDHSTLFKYLREMAEEGLVERKGGRMRATWELPDAAQADRAAGGMK